MLGNYTPAQLAAHKAELRRRQVQRKHEEALHELELARSAITQMKDQLDVRLKRADQALGMAETNAKRLETALEEERSKNRVLTTTVEALVASNDVYLKRWDAEAAIQDRRAIAAKD